MASVAQAVFSVCARLSLPASGVLLGALTAAVVRGRRGRGSTHWCLLTAHVATLLGVSLVRALYLLGALDCTGAVPAQSFIELSAACWLHAVCINFILSFRDSSNARESYANLFISLAYAWCGPTVIMIAFEFHVEEPWVAFKTPVYDTKTCFFTQGPLANTRKRDVSVILAMLRGIGLLITSLFFIYLSFKTGYQRINVVLCQEDSGSHSDITSRQNQAMKYILVMVITGVVEVSSDLSAWYWMYMESESKFHLSKTQNMESEESSDFLMAQWVSKSISLSVDFTRALLVLELVCRGGPSSDRRPQCGSRSVVLEDPLPSYELAAVMPRPQPKPRPRLSPVAPPPSYASMFGERSCLTEEEAALLETTPPATPAVLDDATRVTVDLLKERC